MGGVFIFLSFGCALCPVSSEGMLSSPDDGSDHSTKPPFFHWIGSVRFSFVRVVFCWLFFLLRVVANCAEMDGALVGFRDTSQRSVAELPDCPFEGPFLEFFGMRF